LEYAIHVAAYQPGSL